MKAITLELPYPPSANHYWRRVGARTLISAEGRRYRARIAATLALKRVRMMTGSLYVRVNVHPPDRRRRDLDNTMKALLDALAHGGAYEDDSQIEHLEIVRCESMRDGKVVVRIAGIAEMQHLWTTLAAIEWSGNEDDDACPFCAAAYNDERIHLNGCYVAAALERPTRPTGELQVAGG